MTQLISHLHVFLQHTSKSTIPGTLLWANLENLTMELGSGHPFWDLDYETWAPIVTPSWLKSTWHDMHITGVFVHGSHTPIPLSRLHDCYLMDTFVAHQLPPDHHCILNEVRLFNQVTCLSDIVMADGIYLDPSTFMPTTPTKPKPYNWPQSTHPNTTSISVWKHYLCLCYLKPHTFTKRLRRSLGPWTRTSHNTWE